MYILYLYSFKKSVTLLVKKTYRFIHSNSVLLRPFQKLNLLTETFTSFFLHEFCVRLFWIIVIILESNWL